ncbi:MAG: serine/threonine protein kinase [Kiritimatiellae bacterium]|nr:serine/threonine protein kinase [Kiritimatiellia bacterium]
MISDTIQNGCGELPRQCGEYWLRQEIGRGAYGTVYLASAPDGGRVAVKVCRRDDIGDERFERELRGAKLYRAIPPQEGLVRMLELVESPWGFFAVMELADDEFGGPQEASAGYRPKTLASVIAGEKALPLGECVKLGITLAKGLAALQRHHLLHRDIKPGNVIYVGGRPVLSDPGLVVEEAAAASLVGTPGYVPPESFTAASGDVYSLGLTLKAASFGRKIEDLDKGPALEADTGAKFFPAWWRILNKATDPTPSRRYQSAKALLKDLESLNRRIVIAASPWFKAAIAFLALAVLGVIWLFAAASGRSVTVQSVKEALLEDAIKNDPNLQRIRSGELDRELSTQFEEMKNEQKEHLARLQADFAPKSTDNESDESDSK